MLAGSTAVAAAPARLAAAHLRGDARDRRGGCARRPRHQVAGRVASRMSGQQIWPGSFVSIDHVENSGAAFSVLPQLHWLYLAVALVVSLYIVFSGYRYGTTWYRQVLIGMILGGALSNGVDRLVQGSVVDFIDFHFWPVFNVADSCIVVAIIAAAGAELRPVVARADVVRIIGAVMSAGTATVVTPRLDMWLAELEAHHASRRANAHRRRARDRRRAPGAARAASSREPPRSSVTPAAHATPIPVTPRRVLRASRRRSCASSMRTTGWRSSTSRRAWSCTRRPGHPTGTLADALKERGTTWSLLGGSERAGHRAPPRPRHQRAAGGRQDRGRASQPGQAAQRSLARAHLLGARARWLSRGHRDHRRARSRVTLATAGAWRSSREAARRSPTSVWSSASAARPCSRSRCAPGGPTRFACTSRRSVIRSSATACTDAPTPTSRRPALHAMRLRLRHPDDGTRAILRIAGPRGADRRHRQAPTRGPMSAHGRLIVLTGPSGVGKDTVLRELFALDPSLEYCVSYTTRPPRPGEIEGVSYFFVDEPTFRAMIDRDEFFEWSTVYGELKGRTYETREPGDRVRRRTRSSRSTSRAPRRSARRIGRRRDLHLPAAAERRGARAAPHRAGHRGPDEPAGAAASARSPSLRSRTRTIIRW